MRRTRVFIAPKKKCQSMMSDMSLQEVTSPFGRFSAFLASRILLLRPGISDSRVTAKKIQVFQLDAVGVSSDLMSWWSVHLLFLVSAAADVHVWLEHNDAQS